tara:strand:+ start:2407 stop:2949 length:543 start_codon:yes stop_codon:yes gene_type:complete
MGNIGKDFKYKKINNFLSKEEIDLLSKYTDIKHVTNVSSFDNQQSNVMDTFFYGDPLMDSLMLSKKNIMEKETGKKLLPTYAFWRMYTKFSDLKKHKDRPSCEISVTVNINNDGTPWPIYIEGEAVELKSGEAVIYMGCELEHWREEFLGDWHAQTFLHYVDEEGKNSDWYMDKRQYWGK